MSIKAMRIFGLLSFVALAFVMSASPRRASALVSGQHLAIPSYFNPDPAGCTTNCYWVQLDSGAPTVGIAIINPNSGPGKTLDQNYVNTTRTAQAKGITVLGYVHTSYGRRNGSQVKGEIDKYYNWYGVDGIFFDEASNDCAKQSYYLNLYNYVKGKGGKAVDIINPGINTPECYITAADIIVNFEDNYTNYQMWAPSGWEFNYPASRFWQLVIGATDSQLSNAISLSKNRNAGWIYVTNDTLPNPWDTLPANPYWSNELTLAAQ